jgi:hypothetical protein
MRHCLPQAGAGAPYAIEIVHASLGIFMILGAAGDAGSYS